MRHEEETVITFLCEQHWKQLGVWDGWPIEKAEQVAQMYDKTLFELGAACAVTIPEMRRYIKKGRVPASVAAQMLLLQGFYHDLKLRLGEIPTFPIETLLTHD